MSQEAILTAIYEDDRARLQRVLRADSSLATLSIGEAMLFRGQIMHWIYVEDTPLHLAAAGQRVEMVRLLLATGADPNSAMNHRRSGPLHYAADSKPGYPGWDADRQVKVMECLLESGARIDAQDKNGATPLHRAVRTRGAAAVKCLLEAGANPSLQNKPGSTPFHLAVQNTGRGGSGLDAAKSAQRQIIQEFLSFGVSPAQKDAKGKSVRDWVRSDWIREILQA